MFAARRTGVSREALVAGLGIGLVPTCTVGEDLGFGEQPYRDQQ